MRELSGEQWIRVIDELREWIGPEFLSITGGEAMLHKSAIEIARHAAGKGFWVEFLTNGWVVNEENASKLIASGVRRIKVSLDGVREETHDRIRGIKGFYRRSLSALQSLADCNQKAQAGIQIYAKTAIMQPNIDEVSELARIAKELGIYGVEYQAIEPVYHSDQQDDANWYRDNPLWISDSSVAQQAIDEIRSLKASGYPVINSDESLQLIADYFRDPDAESTRVHSHDYSNRGSGCTAWAKGLQIEPDGGMKMCHWMPPFANAADGGLEQSWRVRASCPRCGCP
jgi:MoaA/NifB/PqqE/SkfB family radical SAM enzyme